MHTPQFFFVLTVLKTHCLLRKKMSRHSLTLTASTSIAEGFRRTLSSTPYTITKWASTAHAHWGTLLILRGIRVAHKPNQISQLDMSHENSTSQFYISVSSETVQSSETISETEHVATIFPAESLHLNFHPGCELTRRLAHQVFVALHQHVLKKPLLVIDGKRKDFYPPKEQGLPRTRFHQRNARFGGIENKRCSRVRRKATTWSPRVFQSHQHKHLRRNAKSWLMKQPKKFIEVMAHLWVWCKFWYLSCILKLKLDEQDLNRIGDIFSGVQTF